MTKIGDNSGSVNADELRAFIDRVERLEEEKANTAQDIKEVYGEAKSSGYDVKVMRKVVSLRRQDADKRRAEAEILDLYMAALGFE